MQKPKKIVLFDIDHTIFDGILYRKTLYANIARQFDYDFNQFSENADREYKKLRDSTNYFTPDTFLNTILTNLKETADHKEIKDIFWDKKLYETCIYPDVKKIFSFLKKRGFQIGIFSTGDLAHQKIKIESLREYLSENHIYISPNKLKIIKSTFDGYKDYVIYLVDDFPQILMQAKTHNKNIFTIFIKRGESYPGMIIPDNFKPDATITNFDQLSAIIMTNN